MHSGAAATDAICSALVLDRNSCPVSEANSSEQQLLSRFSRGSASAFRDFTSEGGEQHARRSARSLGGFPPSTIRQCPVGSSLGLEDAHPMTGEGYDRRGAVERETIAMQQVDIILTGARPNCVIGED
jgi:hypothetical protein